MTFVVNFAVALRLWVLVGLLVCQSARAISAETVQNEVFEQELQPIIAKYCLRCHGSELQEGDLRIDRLDPDLLNGKDADFWHEVLNQLNEGEMPPQANLSFPGRNSHV